MAWKEKLFTLIGKRFYTKEEIDKTSTVIFIVENDGSITIDDTNLNIIAEVNRHDCKYTPLDSSRFVISVEIPRGYYQIEPTTENSATMILIDEAAFYENRGSKLSDMTPSYLESEQIISINEKTIIIGIDILIDMMSQNTTQ